MKDYEELKFTDDFMFCKILQENEDLCKEAIEKRLWRKEYMTYKEQMDMEYSRGREEGIIIFIEDKLEDNVPADIIEQKLCKKFGLTEEKAKAYIDQVSGA